MSIDKTEETIGRHISDTHSMRVWRLFPSHRQPGNYGGVISVLPTSMEVICQEKTRVLWARSGERAFR